MKIKEYFIPNPTKDKKYKDFINYIDTASVIDGKLLGCEYLIFDFPSRAQRHINKNDILYSTVRPNLRHFYFYKDNYEHAVASTGFTVLRKKANVEVNEQFVYYFLSTNEIVRHLSNIAELSQSTFPTCSSKDIVNIDLPDFSFLQQTKIANILSAYDELIENSNKRIKLLEQMAENLYKEWFVRFRFPTYEKCKFIGSVPYNWEEGYLSNLCSFSRGKNITSEQMVAGEYEVISAGLEPSGYHNEANVKGISITVSASGANAGYVSLHQNDIWAADCSYVTSQNTKNIYYLYGLINSLRPIITNLQIGSAQPHVYPKQLNKMKVLIPLEYLMNLANDKLSCFYKLINTLIKQNQNLIKQRDLLLPRLMSGKLEV